MDSQVFSDADSTYKHLKTELTELNLQKINLENSISELRAETVADVLEKGGDKYETLYDAKLRTEEKKFKKIYGNKAVSQMKGDFKRSVTDVTIMLQKKIIHQYEEAKSLFEKSEKALVVCIENLRVRIPQ
jgi:hypothetical protein